MDYTVDTETPEIVKFEDMDYGELFEFQNEIFMKIHDEDLIEGAVELRSGCATFNWNASEEVTPMLAQVTITKDKNFYRKEVCTLEGVPTLEEYGYEKLEESDTRIKYGWHEAPGFRYESFIIIDKEKGVWRWMNPGDGVEPYEWPLSFEQVLACAKFIKNMERKL